MPYLFIPPGGRTKRIETEINVRPLGGKKEQGVIDHLPESLPHGIFACPAGGRIIRTKQRSVSTVIPLPKAVPDAGSVDSEDRHENGLCARIEITHAITQRQRPLL